jgi:hypothetical protein
VAKELYLPMLYDRHIDPHIGLNDVLLIHENGKREVITRQEHEKRIKKEEGFTGVREPNEPKRPNNKRSGLARNVKHQQGNTKRIAPSKQLSFGKIKSQ